MEVLNDRYNEGADGGCVHLGELALCDDSVEEGSALELFENEIDFELVLVRLLHLNDVWVIQPAQQAELLVDEVPPIRIALVLPSSCKFKLPIDFGSIGSPRLLMTYLAHFKEVTTPIALLLQLIVLMEVTS
uniref:Uncharacterized protein n=1 Tax=Strombidium inclinatum TaxID=197538 RepID=A0A7S3IVC7_9SPIT